LIGQAHEDLPEVLNFARDGGLGSMTVTSVLRLDIGPRHVKVELNLLHSGLRPSQ
jgi:hypothetical protein